MLLLQVYLTGVTEQRPDGRQVRVCIWLFCIKYYRPITNVTLWACRSTTGTTLVYDRMYYCWLPLCDDCCRRSVVRLSSVRPVISSSPAMRDQPSSIVVCQFLLGLPGFRLKFLGSIQAPTVQFWFLPCGGCALTTFSVFVAHYSSSLFHFLRRLYTKLSDFFRSHLDLYNWKV